MSHTPSYELADNSFHQLSLRKIRMAVRGVNTFQEWSSLYRNEAIRLRNHERKSLNMTHGEKQKKRLAYLEEFGRIAIRERLRQLKHSDAAVMSKAAVAAARMVHHVGPVLSPAVKLQALKMFNKAVIKRLGLADFKDLAKLQRDVLVKSHADPSLRNYLRETGAELNEAALEKLLETYVEQLKEEMETELAKEFSEQVADTVVEGLFHAAAVIGHAYSAYKGWESTATAVDAIMLHLGRFAIKYHQRTYIPHAVATVFPPPPSHPQPVQGPASTFLEDLVKEAIPLIESAFKFIQQNRWT